MASLGQFIARRRASWGQLEALLARSQGNGLRALSADELDALGRGYRQVVSDLALARRDFPDDQLTVRLNALAAQAHLRLYRAPSGSWGRLGRVFTADFARRLGAARAYLLAAAALFFVPAVWAYVAAQVDPSLRDALVPAPLRRIMERGETWTDVQAVARPLMATLVFTNNLQVSFLAFAGGVLFGLGTAYVLVANGLQIGGVLGAAQHYGVAPQLWAFVAPHGYLEIASILISAAAGLSLGDALLRPGLLRRRDRLVRTSREALGLVLGAAPVFVVAGLIEGLISPGGLPAVAKLAIGPLAGLVLFGLVLALGRRAARSQQSAASR